jgi:hypothetical protein
LKDIGWKVSDIFRDGTVDVQYASAFHVGVNQRTKTVRFFLRLTTDSGVTRALVYNYMLDRWSMETYPWAVGANVEVVNTSGVSNFYISKYFEAWLREREAVASDGIATAFTGTVDSVVGVRLNATASIFSAGYVHAHLAPVTFTSGAAKGESRLITAYDSGTGVDLSSMPSGVAAGDTFVVGGIPWSYKTGMLDYPRNALEHNERAIEVLFKPTTATGNYLDIRHYLGYATAAENSATENPENDAQCKTAFGDPNGVVTLDKTRSALADSVGFARKLFSGRNAHGIEADRNVSVEIRGVTGNEIVQVKQINVVGAS